MHLGSFDTKVGSPEVKVDAMCDDQVHCPDCAIVFASIY